MFSFHKPKIYRSNNGCCICRAKSSSSRFTDSSKYEQEFEKCFRIREKRCGEICNACVLLVKRWKKLPDGTSRHWNHVVDARAGPGTKSTLKIKNKLSPSMHKYKSPLKTKQQQQQQRTGSQQHNFPSIPSPLPEELSGYEDSLDKSDIFSQGMSDSEDSDSDDVPHTTPQHITKTKSTEEQISPFLDLTYWKKTKVCCGTIFKGLNGEVLVDPQLLKPCWTCRMEKSRPQTELKRSPSLEDTDSNSSVKSYSLTDYYGANTPEPETPPDSPPNSPHANLLEAEALTKLQCSGKMDYVSNCPLTMEC